MARKRSGSCERAGSAHRECKLHYPERNDGLLTPCAAEGAFATVAQPTSSIGVSGGRALLAASDPELPLVQGKPLRLVRYV